MSYLWTVEGWKSNLQDYLQSPASVDDKMNFVSKYVDWMLEDNMEYSCDNCDRISPDDIGEYLYERSGRGDRD